MAVGGLASLEGGGYLEGATDGQADLVPADIDGVQEARLSHGEYVLPADLVAILGNGNSDAGAKALDEFMATVRKEATGTPKQQKNIDADKALQILMRGRVGVVQYRLCPNWYTYRRYRRPIRRIRKRLPIRWSSLQICWQRALHCRHAYTAYEGVTKYFCSTQALGYAGLDTSPTTGLGSFSAMGAPAIPNFSGISGVGQPNPAELSYRREAQASRI